MNILKPINRTLILLTMVMTVAVLAPSLFGQGPLYISYQGRLTDSAGEPITGTPPMTFTIYDAAGTSKWSELHPSVLVDNGLFNVNLGSQTTLPDSVFNGEDRYLGIGVDGEVELSPRTLLTSSPGAAYARQLIGDVVAEPGILLVKTADGDSAMVLVADPGVHAMRLHPPDPCVPLQPCLPAFEVTSDVNANAMKINWGCPPDDVQPAFEVVSDATAGQVNMKLSCPPDDVQPVFEVVSDAATERVTMTLSTPPDDTKPSLELAVDAAASLASIKMACPPDDIQPVFEVLSDAATDQVNVKLSCPPDDMKPGIEFAVDAAASTASFRMATPPDDTQPAFEVVSDAITEQVTMTLGTPPDDNKPSVEIASSLSAATLTLQGEDPTGAVPTIAMSTDATGAKVGIGTDSFIEALTVMGNGWFSGDVFIFTATRAKTNIVPIYGALDKVSRMNGYYYDCRTDEYPGLRLPANRQVGFLAEEVNRVVPEAVGENEHGLTGVSYSRITALLVEAVKELKAENEELRSRLDAVESR